MNEPPGAKRKLRSYRELEVWKLAVELAENIYRLTRSFPADERRGLTRQLRRTVVAIPTRLAEGFGRAHRADFARYISDANAAACEAESLLLVATKLGFIDRQRLGKPWQRLQRISRKLNRLMLALRKKTDPKP